MNWKKIKTKDLTLLQAHFHKYGEYSDFSAVNLWSFMAPEARWSLVGDTIIYELYDYNSDEKYFSLLGSKDTVEALEKLILDLGNEQIQIRHVPKTILKSLVEWDTVTSYREDHDNHDYIYSVDSLIKLNNSKLRKRKKHINSLRDKHDIKVKLINHQRPDEKYEIYEVFRGWINSRNAENWEKEFKALRRALNLTVINLDCLGAYDGNKLIGFTINEAGHKGYYQGHFGKADYSYKGIGLLLEHETAKYMKKHYGSNYLNLQQDLGIEGIRFYKTSLGPIKQLKKYAITAGPVRATSTKKSHFKLVKSAKSKLVVA